MTSRALIVAASAVSTLRKLYAPTGSERTFDAMRVPASREAAMLTGKRVLITGSTRGIGRAVAEGFAGAGARVVVHGRHEDQARKVASALPGAIGIAADLREPGSGRHLVARAVARLGGLDIVINNAAIHDPTRKPVWQTSTEELDALLRVNVVAAFDVSAAAISAMLGRGINGRIVNISSRAGDLARTPTRGTASYSVSKVALEGLSRCLADEAPGVVVTTLRPAAVQTELTRAIFTWDQHARMLPAESMVGPTLYLATADPEAVHGRVFDQVDLMRMAAAQPAGE